MKILFIDPCPIDYVIESPRVKPLGGSQSGLCYLAEELATRGHEVTLANQTSTPRRSRGIECLNINQCQIAEFGRFEIIILMNWASRPLAEQIRAGKSPNAPLILWSQHNADQPAMEELADRSSHGFWDGYVFVSDWQARPFWERFGIDPKRSAIIGNAIGPPFETLFEGGGRVADLKPWPPVLCYTSTPFRGLDVLLAAFPAIRAAIPGTRLRVFSSMKVYGPLGDNDPYGDLYRSCRETEGVEYVGSLPQVELARQLKQATALSYANTFAEGYCIAVLEAMAAGCLVMTSNLGSLPVTTAGFGHLLAPNPDKMRYAEEYAAFAVRALNELRASPLEQARLERQVRYVNETGTWAVRAREWESAMRALIAREAAR